MRSNFCERPILIPNEVQLSIGELYDGAQMSRRSTYVTVIRKRKNKQRDGKGYFFYLTQNYLTGRATCSSIAISSNRHLSEHVKCSSHLTLKLQSVATDARTVTQPVVSLNNARSAYNYILIKSRTL